MCAAQNIPLAFHASIWALGTVCVAHTISLVASGSFWAPDMECIDESLAQDVQLHVFRERLVSSAQNVSHVARGSSFWASDVVCVPENLGV